MIASGHVDVWVLLGPHKGDNDQVLALAEGLGMPFRTIEMRYRWFGHLPALWRGVTLSPLTMESRAAIAPPWPSLVIGIGQRSAPIARYIRRQSGGRAKLVRLGDPIAPAQLFDLIITTPQYAIADGSNVIRLPITISNACEVEPNDDEERWLAQMPRPLRVMVIGGKTSLWRFTPAIILRAAKRLRLRAAREGGSVVAVTSPRTSPELRAAAEIALGEQAVIDGRFPRYGALLTDADEVHVTGDSVSMLSDAVASGKPVGLIPLEPNWLGRMVRKIVRIVGRSFQIRDLQAFWDELESRGLAGSVDAPRRGSLEAPPLKIALEAIASMDQSSGQRVVAVSRPPQPTPATAQNVG